MTKPTLWDAYQRLGHRLIWPLLEISWRGMRVDQDARRAAVATYKEQEAQLRLDLDAAVGSHVDPLSPKQLMDWLYGQLGVKAVQRTRKRPTGQKVATSTLDEEAIKELLARPTLPQQARLPLSIVLRIRDIHKMVATYLEAPLDSDGRIRCGYSLTGTETGRLSSHATAFGTGTNLQNVPPGIARDVVVADPGCVFVQADLSQAEARVVAYLAREQRLIDVFNQGGDIHRRNAAAIFKVPEAAVTIPQRSLAKKIVHASNYGMGIQKFARETGLPIAEAKRLREQYFATYPGIKRWHLSTEDTLLRTRILTTPYGRMRQFFGPWGDDLVREGLAFVPQSTVADCLNQGLIAYHEQGPGEILLQVHDSVLVSVVESQQQEVVEALRHHLRQPILVNGAECVIPVDVKVGKSWGSLH